MKFASVYIIQDDIVKKNIMEKMDYIIVGVMLLLSLSCCISEALARNCTRVLMVLTVFIHRPIQEWYILRALPISG